MNIKIKLSLHAITIPLRASSANLDLCLSSCHASMILFSDKTGANLLYDDKRTLSIVISGHHPPQKTDDHEKTAETTDSRPDGIHRR
jgi:hypothetical protein